MCKCRIQTCSFRIYKGRPLLVKRANVQRDDVGLEIGERKRYFKPVKNVVGEAKIRDHELNAFGERREALSFVQSADA